MFILARRSSFVRSFRANSRGLSFVRDERRPSLSVIVGERSKFNGADEEISIVSVDRHV